MENVFVVFLYDVTIFEAMAPLEHFSKILSVFKEVGYIWFVKPFWFLIFFFHY